MNLPSGLIFYLDFKYGTDQSLQGSKDGSLFGGTGSKLGSTDEATGGLYGAGRHGYSINDKSVTIKASGGKIALPSDADLEGVRAFTATSGEVSYLVSADGSLSGDAGGAYAPADDADVALVYHAQTTAENRGDFEDGNQNENGVSADALDTGLQEDIGIPEVNLELKSEPIVAKTRKLKAVWTPELAQDLNAYHSIDAEAELTSLLSEYVSMEIDLEILDMLIVNAHTDGGTFNALLMLGLTGGETQGTLFQKLGTKIQKVSNTIHQLTLRGGANFLVCSPQVATVLESIWDTRSTQTEISLSSQWVLPRLVH